ncbi:hypothetical protein, partial [Anoxybacillus sp. J5B_2022]|uniref:hypothetical protein n=1 Tax=Anoxybacillus sp. J5B_2022 TaxID=3003246 RepID=UPI002286B7DD
KETKKYEVYVVEFESLGKFVVKNPKFYEEKVKINNETSEAENYSVVKFENQATGNKSQCECFQEDILSDLKSDVEKIKNNQIYGTNFYSNWMKLIFEKGKKYNLIMNGINVIGTFIGQDTFRKNTFYFIVNGEKVRADGLFYKGYRL